MESRDWDLAISPQTLVDQINQEGKTWGLRGEYDPEAQRVFVIETAPGCSFGGGLGDSSGEDTSRRLCSVDDAHPFSAVLANRIHALEVIGAQRGRMSADDERKQKEKEAASRAHAQQWFEATALRRRGGARFWAGMNEDLSAYRRAKRLRDEMRAKGIR